MSEWPAETPEQRRERTLRNLAATGIIDAPMEELQAVFPSVRDYMQRMKDREVTEARAKERAHKLEFRLRILVAIAGILAVGGPFVGVYLGSHSSPQIVIEAPTPPPTPSPTPTVLATPTPGRAP